MGVVDHITISRLQISMPSILLHMSKCNCKRYNFTREKKHKPKFEVQKLRILRNIDPQEDTLCKSTVLSTCKPLAISYYKSGLSTGNIKPTRK